MKPIYQTNSQLKAKARMQLEGKYSGAILILILIECINLVVSSMITSLFPTGSILSFIIRLGATYIASTFVWVFQLGIILYFLKIACNQQPSLQDIFYGFKNNLEKHLLLSLIITAISFIYQLSGNITLELYLSTYDVSYLYKGLPIMLVVMVAYIYVSLLFSQVTYLMLDFPNYGVKQVFQKSLELMKGNMWRLFRLELSFFPLILLSFLTCGIGLLWIMPYMHMTSTNFYLDLMNPNIPQEQPLGANIDMQV